MKKLSQEIKVKGVERPDEKPQHLIVDSLESTGIKIYHNHLKNLRQVLFRHRRSNYSSTPKTKSECLSKLKEMSLGGDDLVI